MEVPLQQFWLFFSSTWWENRGSAGTSLKAERKLNDCGSFLQLGSPYEPVFIGQRVLSTYSGEQKGGGGLVLGTDQKPEPSVLIVGWRFWLPTFRQISLLYVSVMNILPWWLEVLSTSCSSVLKWKLGIFRTRKNQLSSFACPEWKHKKRGPCSSGVFLAAHSGLEAGNHVSKDLWERKREYYQENFIWPVSQLYLPLGWRVRGEKGLVLGNCSL